MRLDNQEESENVEDRRSLRPQAAGGVVVGGGGLLLAVVLMLLGLDPRQALNMVAQPQQQQQQEQPGQANLPDGEPPKKIDPKADPEAYFTSVILHDTEVVWGELFEKNNKTYKKPTLVLFRGMVESACGRAEASTGPFYCPGDSKVYIDLSFYQDMQKKLNAPGDFARAYVVAHEVGHHVQHLLGWGRQLDEARQSGDKAEMNRMSVRLELQADYLAGVWAYHGQKKFQFLEPGDVDSALNAAFEIGDDRLEKKAQGYVVPDSFTHGTSKQRMRWFSQGFKTGDVGAARKAFELEYDAL
jgi:predicted metalloprotease